MGRVGETIKEITPEIVQGEVTKGETTLRETAQDGVTDERVAPGEVIQGEINPVKVQEETGEIDQDHVTMITEMRRGEASVRILKKRKMGM